MWPPTRLGTFSVILADPARCDLEMATRDKPKAAHLRQRRLRKYLRIAPRDFQHSPIVLAKVQSSLVYICLAGDGMKYLLIV